MTSQPPTNPDLDTIEARANAATPGPWGSHRDLAGTYTIQARPRSTRYGMETDGDIATLAAGRSDAESYANARFIAHARTDVDALVVEVRQLRAALEEIRHLHKDSPMGPCPVCIDADAVAEGRDGLMPYPCPTGRLAGAQDFAPPHVRAAIESGTGPCGHDDYHDPHEWADKPGVWCPGHSHTDAAAPSV